MSTVADMPPPFPWVAKCPCTLAGSTRRNACERAGLCVCVCVCVCGPCHWREMAVSNLTRESAQAACVPGSEFPQQAYPGGGDDGYPQGQESVGARGVRELGNTFVET